MQMIRRAQRAIRSSAGSAASSRRRRARGRHRTRASAPRADAAARSPPAAPIPLPSDVLDRMATVRSYQPQLFESLSLNVLTSAQMLFDEFEAALKEARAAAQPRPRPNLLRVPAVDDLVQLAEGRTGTGVLAGGKRGRLMSILAPANRLCTVSSEEQEHGRRYYHGNGYISYYAQDPPHLPGRRLSSTRALLRRRSTTPPFCVRCLYCRSSPPSAARSETRFVRFTWPPCSARSCRTAR